jgi:hypothetical protein
LKVVEVGANALQFRAYAAQLRFDAGDVWPICTEMWPGNTADVSTLLKVIDRLRAFRHWPGVRRC